MLDTGTSSKTWTVSPATSRVLVWLLFNPAAGTVGSNSNLTTSPPFVFMSAWTLPLTSLNTLAVENCSASASAALPSAYRLDSASACDSTLPSARTLTVRPPWMKASWATVTVEFSRAHETAIDAAKPLVFLPGTLPCSSREVSVVIDAVAFAAEVTLTGPPPSISTLPSIVIVAVASACE